MPHVIVKLWPGKPEAKKQELARKIAKAVMETMGYGADSVSVSLEEVAASDWLQKVYKPDIEGKPDTLYKKPGYDASAL